MSMTILMRYRYKKGNIPWNKGLTRKTDERIDMIAKRMEGEGHPNWKGDNVTYKPLHIWLNRHKQKRETCEICNEKKILELSNIDHKYTRNLEDYQWLCKSCHSKYDIKKGLREFNLNDSREI